MTGTVARLTKELPEEVLSKFLHDISVTPNAKWGTALNGLKWLDFWPKFIAYIRESHRLGI